MRSFSCPAISIVYYYALVYLTDKLLSKFSFPVLRIKSFAPDMESRRTTKLRTEVETIVDMVAMVYKFLTHEVKYLIKASDNIKELRVVNQPIFRMRE